MLKQARLLTHPTLARRDAPFPQRGRSSTADPRFTFHVSPFTVLERELRTMLADFFNSVLELVLRYAIPQRIPGDLEQPAGFGNIAACALQRFL